jgi:hypothetical protein
MPRHHRDNKTKRERERERELATFIQSNEPFSLSLSSLLLFSFSLLLLLDCVSFCFFLMLAAVYATVCFESRMNKEDSQLPLFLTSLMIWCVSMPFLLPSHSPFLPSHSCTHKHRGKEITCLYSRTPSQPPTAHPNCQHCHSCCHHCHHHHYCCHQVMLPSPPPTLHQHSLTATKPHQQTPGREGQAPLLLTANRSGGQTNSRRCWLCRNLFQLAPT